MKLSQTTYGNTEDIRYRKLGLGQVDLGNVLLRMSLLFIDL